MIRGRSRLTVDGRQDPSEPSAAMHTKLGPDNPFGFDRWAFAWEHVPRDSAAHLDFGCNDGAFLASLQTRNVGMLCGVDVAAEAIEKAKQRTEKLHVYRTPRAEHLPFDDDTFTSASMLDVLEHLSNQRQVLREIHRVMAPGAPFVVTVPGRHLFSFMDLGNLKFRFPRLHRWYYCRRHSVQEYQDRYVCNTDGLVGDVSAEKRWHEHFCRRGLKAMLHDAGFTVVEFDGSGYFMRPLRNSMHFLKWARTVHRPLEAMSRLDARLFESANLFCLAKKA